MVDYVNQSVEMYCSHVGSKQWPIKDKVHYPLYEPTQQDIYTLGVTPGVFGSSAINESIVLCTNGSFRHLLHNQFPISICYDMDCLM